MEQFKQFTIEKQTVLDTLQKLRSILDVLHGMDMDVADDLQKIASAITSIESDVLRIALVGAFSDGKTSVVAAWLGKVMEDMKIDMDESSDRLAIYRPEGLPGQCEIVDTPGLFGDKERNIDGEQVMYEDLTKRYISEAHLILYVVDATNPLKDSHNDVARWILRDLNKLESTVFVINKMDEVTDLSEQTLFDEQAAIKKDNLKGKLQRAANLNPDELARLNIVCIASDPNGRGLDTWFKRLELYESRSRINDLKNMTTRLLQANVPDVLIAKTGLDVVQDIVSQRVASANEYLQSLDLFARQNAEEAVRFEEDIQKGRREVKQLSSELFNELQAMETQLLGRLRPLSFEDIQEFLEDELGYTEADGVGYKLNLRIKTAIDRFFDQSSAVTQRLSDDISRQLNSSESFIDAIGNSTFNAISSAVKGFGAIHPDKIKNTIFMARDAIGKLTGYVYKFKPWQASKLAGNLSRWAGPAGTALSISSDIYSAYKTHERETELQNLKNDIGDFIKASFKDIYDILRDDETMFQFFAPQIAEVEKVVSAMSEKSATIRESQEKLISINAQLEQLALREPDTVMALSDEPA